ncbi:MaoC family dehydratase [Verticiella sediminum]|uniref:MaoC family dehydratase n=1 Tax=Verticiella sediminum TaxID=1247510 RepID=A0A556ALX3_9BURK|nr:MaoC family dehydratase [Verticiella sediminum]TSH93900.1 MaoC family dehydratase [Verticiella sediminum]
MTQAGSGPAAQPARPPVASDGKRWHLEDFTPGQRQHIGEFSLSKEEIIAFARQFDPQVFHTDEEAAKHSSFGGLVASGWHTCSRTMRALCDAFLLEAASGGSPGVQDIAWKKPVLPDQTIRIERETLEIKPSRSKPDRGMVLSELRLTNPAGEVVMTMRSWGMFFRRPQG